MGLAEDGGVSTLHTIPIPFFLQHHMHLSMSHLSVSPLAPHRHREANGPIIRVHCSARYSGIRFVRLD
jgi:hypothetical protein